MKPPIWEVKSLDKQMEKCGLTSVTDISWVIVQPGHACKVISTFLRIPIVLIVLPSNYNTSLTMGSYFIPKASTTHLGITELLAPESIMQLWTSLPL